MSAKGQKQTFCQCNFGVVAAATSGFKVSNIGQKCIGTKFKIRRLKKDDSTCRAAPCR
jgi:hypothetical protein